MKLVWKYLTGITVGLIVLTSIFVPVYLFVWRTVPPIHHDPIIIWGDNDFSSYELPGEGTAENPYRIENLHIKTRELYSIYIFSTTKFFVIDNCYLESTNKNGYAIYIEGVANGTVKIFNNTLHSSYYGLGLFYSDNSQIVDNQITCCLRPFFLEDCRGTTIIGNTFSNPENESKWDPETTSWRARIMVCHGTNFSQNTVLWANEGLRFNVYSSNEITIADNDLQNVDLTVYDCINATIENNQGIDGVIRVHYSRNNTVNSNDIYSLEIYESTYSVISNNNVSQFSIDINTIYSSITIENNWVNNKIFGIFFSLNNTDFTTSLVDYGQMYFVECNNVTLSNPTILDEILYVNFWHCENISIHDLYLELYLDFQYSDYIEIRNNNILRFKSYTSNNMTIDNNQITDPHMSISYGSNYTIKNNDISKLNYRLFNEFLDSVQDLIMYNNRIYNCDNTIWLYDVWNSVIINNTFENVTEGVRLSGFSNVTFSDNTFSNCYKGGIYLIAENVTLYSSSTFENNYVDGRIIGYYVNLDNVTIDTGNFAQLFLVNCSDLLVKDLVFSNTTFCLNVLYCNQTIIENITCSNSDFGIYVKESTDIQIVESRCSNSEYGIFVDYSTDIQIIDNVCTENERGMAVSDSPFSTLNNNSCQGNFIGIRLLSSSNSTLEGNSIINNSDVGIYLIWTNHCNITYNLLQDNYYWGISLDILCDFNRIYANAFINNNWQEEEDWYTSQAYEWGGQNNLWYNDTAFTGNFWDDWIGSGTYEIDGDSLNYDPYPLSSNPL